MSCKYSFIKIGAWNIEGAYFKVNNYFVNKLREQEFESNIQAHDILCVQETHCGPRDIPSQHLTQFNSIPHCRKKSTNNRYFGGMLLLIRKTIRKGVKVTSTEDPDILRVTLKKDFFNLPEDLKVWFVYAPPANSPYTRNRGSTIAKLEEILAEESSDRHIILGDLNGRTATIDDYIEDSYDPHSPTHNIQLHTPNAPLPRRNMDNHPPDEHGKLIIDLCKTFQARILNGRTAGDRWGNPTRFPIHRAEKPSTIDYGICSQSLMSMVKSFYVLPFSTLSDHCCISICLSTTFTAEEPPKNPAKPTEKVSSPSFQLSKLGTYQLNLSHDSSFDKLTTNIKHQIASKDAILQETVDGWMSTFNNAIFDNAKKSFVTKKSTKKKENPSKPAKWFNDNCLKAKNSLKRTTNDLKKDPFNTHLQQLLIGKRKLYKKTCREAEAENRKHILNQLLTTDDPKKFWKMIKDMKGYGRETADPSDSIAPNTWKEYFKGLLNSKTTTPTSAPRDAPTPTSTPATPSLTQPTLATPSPTQPTPPLKHAQELDAAITMKEFQAALRKIKIGKARGPDGIIAEYIKYASTNVIEALLEIMNVIFTNSIYPSQWTINFLKAIFKSGATDDPGNYRGLAIGSAIAKLYSLITLARLEKYILDNKILTKNQIGFLPGFRTADHIYVLKTIITKYTKNKGKLYAAFIDFKKAYDLVNRDILLSNLQNYGIGGKMWASIKAIYSKVLYSIRTSHNTLDPITSNLGLKQGCPLSPLLFNLYINDIPKYLNAMTTSKNNITLQGEDVDHFLYADDLVILSSSRAGLQEKLHGLGAFADAKELTINTKKSKVMVFNESGKTLRKEFCYIKDEKLEVVSKYTYLGVDIPSSGSFCHSIKELTSNKAKRAMMPLFTTIMKFNIPVTKALQLFRTYVEPVLLYNSENQTAMTNKQIEKCTKDKAHIFTLANNSPLTTTQLKFTKFLLGVGKFCPSMMVFGESASIPLLLKAHIHMLKFWNRIKDMDDQTLVKLAYRENVLMNSNWCKTIQILHSSFNLHNRLPQSKEYPGVVKKKIPSDFTTYWKSRISDPSIEKKLGLYSKIKHKFAIEPYMNLPFRDRQIISKMVGSSHKLQIETGRHHDVPREERLCKLCDLKKVEDEEHFISECPAYSKTRLEYFGEGCHNAKDLLLTIEPAIMAEYLRKIYSSRDLLLDQKSPEFHSQRISTMKLCIAKGPKRGLMVQNVTKDGLKIKIAKTK